MSSTFKHPLSIMAKSYRLRVPSHTRIATTEHSSRSTSQPISPYSCRQFSQSAWLAYPRKDSQHKDSINTEATEYSKSATDDESARQEDAAFSPDITDPQKEKEVAGKGQKGENSPLDVSPANPEVSKQRGATEGGAENSSASSHTQSDRSRSSGGGSPKKGSQVS